MNKFNARKVYLDGYTFDSKAEAARYCELKLLERAGDIRNLLIHPKFIIVDGFTDNTGKRQRPAYYVGDFQYYDNDGNVIVEDVKGGRATQTALFRLKAKLFKRRYPEIDFRVVEA